MKKFIFIFLFLLTLYLEITNLKQSNQIIIDMNAKNTYHRIENDIVGKTKIENTPVYEPLLQTNNNDYYLTHNVEKKQDKKGATFIDYRNQLTDKKLLIYDQNSKNSKVPFQELEKYLDENYFNKNKNTIITLNEKTYIYKIFSVMIINPGEYQHNKIVFKEEKPPQPLNWLQENSLYSTDDTITKDDYITSLQTCYYEPENSYLLITTKRREK